MARKPGKRWVEMVEKLKRQYRGEAGFVYRQAFDELLTQLEAHRKEG